jgi:hypothetical protein
MNKLNFASVTDAFTIGSEKINKNQEEINKLKKILENSSIIKNPDSATTNKVPLPNQSPLPQGSQGSQGNTSNISSPSSPSNTNIDQDFEYYFYKLSSNPKFDKILHNYLIVKHPEWLLPMGSPGSPVSTGSPVSYSAFGNVQRSQRLRRDSTVNNIIKKYLNFLIVSFLIYVILTTVLQK